MSITITINRAPVLTLWAAVVAERLGFDRDEALSLGRAVAGLNAHSKGRRLGIFKPHEEKLKEARSRSHGEVLRVEVCGLDISATNTEDGIRAVQRGEAIDPEAVEHYLEDKFGDDLKAVRTAMAKPAKSYSPKEIADEAYPLYERFRPTAPEGKKGWGAKGILDLELIGGLKKPKRGR